VSFEQELRCVLPQDVPNRDAVAVTAARHLDMIVEANRQFNLTRITGEREAAIKHVVDSVMPWRLFAEVREVVDAGSGAGFPGVPLAIALPSVRFVLSESIGKKARFIQAAVEELELTNVHVTPERAEELLRRVHADVLTARAVAPVGRAAPLFARALKQGTRALFYKGPDAQAEIDEAKPELQKHQLQARVVFTYDLPDALGSRTVVEIAATRSERR
jgi:16S rRNA (guanine527-N7)-methyltransferase